VLIHEMGRHDGELGLLAPLLATTRRVVRYDTRGAGFSEKIRGVLKIDTMTDDLIALLDGLGITEKVSLVGTAVGGAIALHTAFRHPRAHRRCDRLEPGDPRFRRPTATAVLARVARFEAEGVRVVADETAANGYPERAAHRPGAVRGLSRPLARQ